jgi:uncharacterized protein YbjT (DUF2867 family)
MKILLTGVTGYIGKRLLPILCAQGHEVLCAVRDKKRFDKRLLQDNISLLEVDFLKSETLQAIPADIDVAYYLLHSMSSDRDDFQSQEALCAQNFTQAMRQTKVQQVIFLSGISSAEHLSKHLSSRKQVESILSQGSFALTTLNAGIIVGSGSASFEIIRDLVEKLPLMITPKWLNTKCQPIAIRNVLQCLTGVIAKAETYNQSYDIGGPDVLTYKEMLLQYAKIRGLRRYIFTIPVMTPRISSYWLYFITSTSYPLAKNLVDSMKNEVVAKDNRLTELLGITLIDYAQAIRLAFDKIEQNQVLSSWKDAQTSGVLQSGIERLVQVPTHGCYKDVRRVALKNPSLALEKIWRIGGNAGWYYADWLWELRGLLDQVFGGVGVRRGRRSDVDIQVGDALDFWRVLWADKDQKRLLLYAEMKLPGEAWLEFQIDAEGVLTQSATFRPLGLLGILYWYAVLPFHGFIFQGMLTAIAKD